MYTDQFIGKEHNTRISNNMFNVCPFKSIFGGKGFEGVLVAHMP